MNPRPCFYCSAPMIPGALWDGSRVTRDAVETSDHVFPRAMLKAMPAQTETWSRRNKVRACSGCNTAKGDLHPLDWLPKVRGPGVDRLRNKLVVLGVSPARIRLALGQSPIPYLRDEYAAGGLGSGRDDTGRKQALPANY